MPTVEAPNPTLPTPPRSGHQSKVKNVLDHTSTPPAHLDFNLAKSSIPVLPATPPRLRQEFKTVTGSPGKRHVTDSQTGKTKLQVLPGHLRTLILLHHAFDVALGLWLATHPPILPPLDIAGRSYETGLDVDLIDLTNYLQIKGLVEKTCGRRFGITELRRLVWVWQWQGDEDAIESLGNLDASQLSKDAGNNIKRVQASQYLITLARTLDPVTTRRTITHGIGLCLRLTHAEVSSITNSLHTQMGANAGATVGMGALGRWSAAVEDRGKDFETKIWKWWELCTNRSAGKAGEQDEVTGETEDMMVPNVPMADLPKLPQARMNLPGATSSAASTSAQSRHASSKPALLPAFNIDSAPSSSSPKLPGPSPRSSLPTPAPSSEIDVFGSVKSIPPPTSSASSSATSTPSKRSVIADRRQALYDRIKARTTREGASSSSSTSNSMLNLEGMSKADAASELKRRSTLSRLEGVAEGVWM